MAYRDVVLADSPVSYWRLDETSGTTAGDSAGSNPGTYSGVTLAGTSLIARDSDAAISFPVAGDATHNVQVADSTSLNFTGSFSLECWFQSSSAIVNEFLVGKGFGSNGNPWQEWSLGTDASGFWSVAVSNAGTLTQISAASAPSLGVPHHIALVFTSGSKVELFGDGVSLSSAAVAFAAVSHYSQPVTFGVLNRGGTYVSGVPAGTVIDEVAVYNTALTAAQVLAHYTAGAGLVPVQSNTGATMKARR